MGAGGELGGHHRVHGDHDLLLLGHQGVALLDLLEDPLSEVVADDGGAHVHDPLLRHLLQVRRVREVEPNLGLAGDVGHHLLEGEVLVLRHVDVLHVLVGEVGLLPTKDVLEEVDGHVIWRKRSQR